MMAREGDEEQGCSVAEPQAGRWLDNWQLFAIGYAHRCESSMLAECKHYALTGHCNCLLCIGKQASAWLINKRLTRFVGRGAACVS